MTPNQIKRKIASVLDLAGINSLGHLIQRALFSPFIRAVNYHIVSSDAVQNFERHLEFYSSRFVDVNEKALRDFLATGSWPHDKPGLILSFDDGTSDHFETVAPLIEKYGFTGWFFVPAGWITDENGQGVEKPAFVGDNTPLTREQLRALDQTHVVGCHTETHCRLSADIPPEKVRCETLDAQKHLAELLGRPVNIFCWVGGEEHTYTKAASELIKRGYELSFMTNAAVVRPRANPHQLQRTNIEAENPLSLVRFQLSGLMDLAYYPKRKRVNKLTA